MKKFAAAISVILFIAAGYFFGTGGGPDRDLQSIEKALEVPQEIQKVQKEGMGPHKYVDAFVTKVTDGDTLEVTYKGESYKVRLLCVDTPESVKQGVPVQEYAKQASEVTKSMVQDQSVKLVFDKGFKDRYGRLLAYVFLRDGTFLNGVLVRNGLARVEIVSPNSTFSDYFYDLQQKAIEEKRGLWGLPENKQPFVKDGKRTYKPRYQVEEKGA